MKYVQFYQKSTGYIAGSIPPRFSDANVKPIEVCGSDGVYILDAEKRMEKMRTIHNICGYKIIKAKTFSDNGTVLFSTF